MDYLILSLIVIGALIIFLLVWLYILHRKSSESSKKSYPEKSDFQKTTDIQPIQKNQNFENKIKRIEEKLREG